MSGEQRNCRVVAVRPSGERVAVSQPVPRDVAERIMSIIESDPFVWDFREARIEDGGTEGEIADA